MFSCHEIADHTLIDIFISSQMVASQPYPTEVRKQDEGGVNFICRNNFEGLLPNTFKWTPTRISENRDRIVHACTMIIVQKHWSLLTEYIHLSPKVFTVFEYLCEKLNLTDGWRAEPHIS